MTGASESIYSTSSRYQKLVITFILCYCNFVVGSCVTFLNPLVLDFSYRFETSVDQVSRAFTVILVSYLVSALLGAVTLNYLNRQLYSLFHLILLVAPFIILPHAPSLIVFLVFSSLIGLGTGGYDTAQIAWMIDVWRHESGPYILCQHFAYSVGTLVPPWLLQPFLIDKNGTDNSINSTTSTGPTRANSELYIPFSVVAGLVIFGILMHCGLRIAYKNKALAQRVQTNPENTEGISGVEDHKIPGDTLKRKVFLVALGCLVIGFYYALELGTSQFLPTFAHFSEVELTEFEGAQMLLSLQLGFCISRLVGIILVLKIAPHFLFAGSVALILVSNVILCELGGSSTTWLRVGSISAGVGMSNVYGTLYAFIEKYIFVDNTVAGSITVAAGLVASIYPLIVGNSIESNPRIFTYVNFVSICVCTIAFATLFWTTRMQDQNKYKEKKSCRGEEAVSFKAISAS